jgi:ribonuclease HI
MTSSTTGAVAYTDGSCLGTPGPGGWGVHVEYPDGRVIELGGGDLLTTNNRMELRAAIEAVRVTLDSPAVTIITDSQYVRRGITEWLTRWKRVGWVTVAGKPVENQALWQELDALADARVTWEWTRGHSGDPGNERCDEIAGWFARSVRPLLGDGPIAPTRPAAVSRPGVSYLSLVDGILARHQTWDECDCRVRGVRGARYKKIRSAAEEADVIQSWGLTPEALYGV